ncbi:MAG: reverse transcriptase N-terminal domain-containing protein [Methanobrevibacter sp.]|nr:reverse transcriptase N-terminal domain-containing protein [Candidatus Methanovirga basalitermitum]
MVVNQPIVRNNSIITESSTSRTLLFGLILIGYRIEKYVNNLQKQIYHAESVNEPRKVRNLQRMLINSKAVLCLAIRKITQKKIKISELLVLMDSEFSTIARELNFWIP